MENKNDTQGNPEDMQDNQNPEYIPKNQNDTSDDSPKTKKKNILEPKNIILKMKQHRIMSAIIIVLIFTGFLAVNSAINNVLADNKVQTHMTKYVKEYNFIDSLKVSDNSLTITANSEYDKLDLKTKYEKLDNLYDDFSYALIKTRNFNSNNIDTAWVSSKVVHIEHGNKFDIFNYSGLKTGDGEEFHSYDLDPPSSTPTTSSSYDSPSYTTPSNDDKSFAWVAAIQTVKENLKAPSTAKFPFSYNGQDIRQTSYNTFVVNSYVDAENGFGAKIRANFSVTIKKTGSESYIVENFYIDQ